MANESKWKVWAKQRTSRNQNWTENETGTLINVWFKYLDKLKLHRRTGKIYEKMAVEFARCGFKRSSIELQKKVSNLTQEYRKEKKKIANGLGPSRWRYYTPVEDIVERLAMKSETTENHLDSTSSIQSEPEDEDNMEDVKFMAVYLNEQSMSEEEQEQKMPVIVSVESRHQILAPDPPPVLPAPAKRTLILRPNLPESSNEKVLLDLRTEMHRVLEESLDLHRQQITMQQRQVVLQEDMLKIMARFIDNCP